jgi:hypothetical protein
MESVSELGEKVESQTQTHLRLAAEPEPSALVMRVRCKKITPQMLG